MIGPRRLAERPLGFGQGGESVSLSDDTGFVAFRVSMPSFSCGTLVLDICADTISASGHEHVCMGVAKAGNFPSKKSGYHWFSGVPPIGSIGWRCRTQAHWWPFSSPELTVVVSLTRETSLGTEPLWTVAPIIEAVSFEPIAAAAACGNSATLTSGGKPVNEKFSEGSVSSFKVSLTLEPSDSTSILDLAKRTATPRLCCAHLLFRELYADIDGSELSLQGRNSEEFVNDAELHYGEIEFLPFYDALCQTAGLGAGKTFVDLGSGTGRAVIAVALGFPELHKCVGVELIPKLHVAAQNALEQLQGRLVANQCRASTIDFIEGDVAKMPWSEDWDVVWISSLCFSSDTLRALEKQAMRLKPGSRVITMTAWFGEEVSGFRRITVNDQTSLTVDMSFGQPQIYALERTDAP